MRSTRWGRYRRSLSDELRVLLGRYRPVDSARKVVGVGSVSTDDAVALLLGDSAHDPLFLQVNPSELSQYAQVCGVTLADGHARSGDPVAIAAYLRSGSAFERAIARFATAYADQTERDFAQFVKTTADG